MVPIVVSTHEEMSTMMTTLFICHQIGLETHDIMYQLPGQFVEIVKPVVQNKMQQSKELEAKKVHVSENYASYVPRNLEVMN